MKALPLTLFAACAVTSLASQAAELDIKLTNLTQGLHFTPILILPITVTANFSALLCLLLQPYKLWLKVAISSH